MPSFSLASLVYRNHRNEPITREMARISWPLAALVAGLCVLWAMLATFMLPMARSADFLNFYAGASLVEQGRIRLNDPVSQFIPGFDKYGKRGITIRHLLTHTSGLRPDLELEVEFHGADDAIRLATEEVPTSPPGERFVAVAAAGENGG